MGLCMHARVYHSIGFASTMKFSGSRCNVAWRKLPSGWTQAKYAVCVE